MITIDATGVTEPDELVDVGAQVSGIIMEFGKDLDGKVVDYSSPVKAGQMLAEIDKLPVQLDVQRAEASKAQAIAGIARAKADIQQAKAKHQQARLDRERAEKAGARGSAPFQSPATTSTLRMKRPHAPTWPWRKPPCRKRKPP